jgi:hypothetical protein
VKRHSHGRRAALVALLVSISLLAMPAAGSAFSKAIWGPLTYQGANQFPVYHQLGVQIYEMDLDWNQVAPTRPKHPTNPNDPAYTWPAGVSEALQMAAPFHMQVLLQIGDAPAWANGGHSNAAWAPKNPQDFANFATAAARKYRTVKFWMVWGEPTRAGNFYPIRKALPGERLSGAQLTAPHLYARILDAAYGALKAVRHSNTVIGGDTYTTGVLDPLQWISNLKLPNGKPPRMDMYAHNPFTYEQPNFSAATSPFDEVQFSDLHELAGWVDRYLHKGIPLFLSEFTIPTQADNEFNFYVDPSVAAQWVTDVLRLSRSYHRIYALGWVNVYDNPPLTYGGLLTQSGTPKPDYYAFEHG